MKFEYKIYPRDPVPGAPEGLIFQPKIPITVYGPTGKISFDALVDTGADHTIFPRFNASHIGAPLHEKNVSYTNGIGSDGIKSFYAEGIELEMKVDNEICRWTAPVWFSEQDDFPALLGRKGFLEYFTATFDGENSILTLEPNGNFSGNVVNIWDPDKIS